MTNQLEHLGCFTLLEFRINAYSWGGIPHTLSTRLRYRYTRKDIDPDYPLFNNTIIMKQFASAYANNDVAIISWKFPNKIPGCLGFCIVGKIRTTGKETTLPAWVGFEGQKNPDWKQKDTSIWPIQKFNWKDLTAPKGGTYIYQIIPMVGDAKAPSPIADPTLHLATSPVAFNAGSEKIKAYFNRGILSTQSLAHKLPKSKKDGPSLATLKKSIEKQDDPSVMLWLVICWK